MLAPAFFPSAMQSKPQRNLVLKVLLNGCKAYELKVGRHTIGRSQQCQVPIQHDLVSRLHAILLCTEKGQVRLVDGDGEQASRNGTYVNGVRITETWLQPGDTIHFGASQVMAKLEISDLAILQEDDFEAALNLYADEPALAEDLTSLRPASEPRSSSASAANSQALSVKELTGKISQLYYELSTLENQLKERDHSYAGLRDDFETFRRQAEQEKDLANLQIQQLSQKLQQSQKLIQLDSSGGGADPQDSNRRQPLLPSMNSQDLLIDLLAVVDNFEIAQQMVEVKTARESEIHHGYQGIHRLLLKSLRKVGVRRFHSLHTVFDPNLHEAVAAEVTEACPEDTVITEHQAGYMLGDLVIRPAKVTVARSARV
ncbi:MAG: nucleotide exchange factor GrpE [Synechococcaceae cyanobacterium SM2_3_1]|nr:nucleotide exchange factor GrpE [Synechococcaceae cyanobacterium SM2_3_1]